jgi:hypothetical protein
MCDYSLAGIRNRLAVAGEALIVHRFCTGSRGLASPADVSNQEPAPMIGWESIDDFSSRRMKRLQESAPAVCVPPGTRLRLHDISEQLQQQLGVGPVQEVTFTQLSAKEYEYRDAIRFENGEELLLQRLSEGQQVEVLALPAEEITAGTPGTDDEVSVEYCTVLR